MVQIAKLSGLRRLSLRGGAITDESAAELARLLPGEPVAVYADGAQYESVVYGKGALFYDAIRQALGDRQFQAFLKSYLRNYRYKIVTPTDLLTELRTYDPQIADSLYEKWIGPLP